MSPRRSGRLRKRSKPLSQSDAREMAIKIVENMEPMASSSPKHEIILQPEVEQVIKKARENLETIKREISRNSRLIKFKMGNNVTKLEFSKTLFAKNLFESYRKGTSVATNSSNTISGISSLSFINLASSTGNSNARLTEKNSFYKTKNQNLNLSKRSNKECAVAVTVTGNRCLGVMKYFSHRRCCDPHSTTSDVKPMEFTSNSTSSEFKDPSVKKLGRRVVAQVTPGPDANKPISVLRRPTAGELAVSLLGSPLLVAPDLAPTSLPQISLPTADGKVVSILPKGGFTVDDMPVLTTPTRHQLKILNQYLNDLCGQNK